jgi:WD40 repeat protein
MRRQTECGRRGEQTTRVPNGGVAGARLPTPAQARRDRAELDEQREPKAGVLIGHTSGVLSVAAVPEGYQALSGSADSTIRLWDLKTGTELRRFKGHTDWVRAVAVLPGGREAVSGSDDGAMRLWDLETGTDLRRFDGHTGWVRSVVALPDGRRAFSGSADGTMRLWDLKTGATLRLFNTNSHGNSSFVAILRDGQRAISGHFDCTVRLWDLNTGSELCRFSGHGEAVEAVGALPDGRRALSGADDHTMRLWDLETGAEINRFDGHTDWVNAVAALSDGRRALSGSNDRTVRLWDLNTGSELRRFEGHTKAVTSVAVLPGERQALSASDDGTIRVWDIEPIHGDSDRVGYTTARIALLGDSGVGKTGLGWRIKHGEFREQASTHGQEFWTIDQLGAMRPDGTQCEAVLWDLAGQADYRLIHALFLDKVDVGLLLFDAANRERPLAGVEYWVRHLRSATLRNSAVGQSSSDQPLRSSAPALLVAARSDRGTPSLTIDEIEEFCRKEEICAYTITSARENTGVSELIERIKTTIPWDRLTATTTTHSFKRIKDHVLALKESSGREAVLLRPEELGQQLENSDPEWDFSDAEMMTAVGHLANHGYVTCFQRTTGEEAILLAPDLLVNLASSIVLEARRHERGLGLVDERQLLAGGYPFPELAVLSDELQTALLDAVAGLFLQRNLCFRETVNNRTFLVFPSLINEKPPSASNSGLTDDVSYRVIGAVETVYPALVIQLGYTNLFRRDHHWQFRAQYELEPGEICSFRRSAERDGEIELVLSYSAGAGDDTRKLFQGAFERFLKRRSVKISRLPAVICTKGHAQERAAVRRAIDNARPVFYCDTCGEELRSPRMDDIGMPAERHVDAVRKAEETTDRRTSYEVALAWVKAFRRDRGDGEQKPTCFISYAWGDRQHERWVEQLVDHLKTRTYK